MFVVRKTAIDAEFAEAGCLEVFAQLSLVVTVEHSDELLPWKGPW